MIKRFIKILKTAPGKTASADTSSSLSNNNICSAGVCTDAVAAGHHIEIRENTAVDAYCLVGSYTYIGKNTTITKTTIGRYCSIGDNVSIGPGEHDLSEPSTSAFFYKAPFDVLTQKPCTIGNDVWIGVDSIIKRGVTIADGAVVGANAVVTKNVPPYAVVAGSPAKIIKFRFDEHRIKTLLESAWWTFDLDEAKQILEKLKKS